MPRTAVVDRFIREMKQHQKNIQKDLDDVEQQLVQLQARRQGLISSLNEYTAEIARQERLPE